MIHFSRQLKRVSIVMALVVVGSFIAAGSASAKHPNTGLSPSLSGYLVPIYAQCNFGGPSPYQANGSHSGPLAVPSCGPGGTTNGPRLQTGGGSPSKVAVGPDTNKPVWPFEIRFTKPGIGAPCANGAVGSTVCLTGSMDSLVSFTTASKPYTAAAPFTGTVGLIARIRFTDHYNCQPLGCTGPYTTQGTGTDTDFGPIPCASAVGGDGKAHCTVNTDANSAVPGAVVNGIKTNIQIFRVRAEILSAPYAGTAQRLLAQQGIAWE